MPLAPTLSLLLVIGASSASEPRQGQKLRTALDDYAAAGNLVRRSIAATLHDSGNVERLQSRLEVNRLLAQRIAKAGGSSEETSNYIKELELALRALPVGPGRPTPLDFDRAIAQDFGPAWQLLMRGNRNQNLPAHNRDTTLDSAFYSRDRNMQLIELSLRKGRFELANGDGAAAIRSFQELLHFTQRMPVDVYADRTAVIDCETLLFVELQKSLPALPSKGLLELSRAIRASVSRPTKLQNCIVGERLSEFANSEVMEKEFQTDPKSAVTAYSYFDPDESPAEGASQWRELFDSLATQSPAKRRIFFQNVRTRIDEEYNSFDRMLSKPEFEWDYSVPTTVTATHLDLYVSSLKATHPDMARFEAEARTRSRIAAITLAAREFAWQHGRYPTELSEFLTKAEAHDPLNNKPFEYSIEQGNIVVKTAVHPILGQITLRKLPADPAAARRPKRP